MPTRSRMPGTVARKTIACLVTLSSAWLATAAQAGAPDGAARVDAGDTAATARGLYLHVGAGALLFSEGAVFKSGGAVIPGGTISISANETLVTEIGYRWGHWGLSATGGFPPVATVNGAGSLASLGSLGRIRYGPTVVSGHYHFDGLGRLQPYVGGGPVFLFIFKNKDDAVRHLDVRHGVGVAVQGGVDFNATRRWGLFVDVKKARLRTTATAVLGGAPISGDVRLDPLVLSGGLSYRF